jgi:hypothetical protein
MCTSNWHSTTFEGEEKLVKLATSVYLALQLVIISSNWHSTLISPQKLLALAGALF